MRQELSETKHPMKMMWGCAAVVLVATILAFATNAYFLLFVIPCMLMMGAMMWMVMGGTRGSIVDEAVFSRGDASKVGDRKSVRWGDP